MSERIITRNQFTATFTGRSEFYSGVRHGERVLLTVQTTTYWRPEALKFEDGQYVDRRQRSHTDLSVQVLDGNSAHLSVTVNELENIQPVGGPDA